ncbi:unannotated protein [freshwater metagenome]|uniref:Unannotated protein n=1 Tax=freshwater metagenome TaxID=449393 RepID=A0A6J5YN79_9ZZZZ
MLVVDLHPHHLSLKFKHSSQIWARNLKSSITLAIDLSLKLRQRQVMLIQSRAHLMHHLPSSMNQMLALQPLQSGSQYLARILNLLPQRSRDSQLLSMKHLLQKIAMRTNSQLHVIRCNTMVKSQNQITLVQRQFEIQFHKRAQQRLKRALQFVPLKNVLLLFQLAHRHLKSLRKLNAMHRNGLYHAVGHVHGVL